MAKLHQYFFLDPNKLKSPFGSPFTFYGLPSILIHNLHEILVIPIAHTCTDWGII